MTQPIGVLEARQASGKCGAFNVASFTFCVLPRGHEGPHRLFRPLDEPQAPDAVDPHGESEGKPSTRV